MLLLVLGGVLAAGCHAFEDATGPSGKMQSGVRPRHDLTNNCNMEQWKCDEIRAGIDYLLNHANVSCRNAGQAALDRFNAPASSGMGYQEAAQVSGYDMGVNMRTGSSVSGWVPSDGYVNVYGSFWNSGYTDPQHAGALLAHEEQHQDGNDGPGHNTGIANAYQTSCLNTSA